MGFFVVFHRCAHIWRSRLVLQSVVVPSSWGILLFDSGDSWGFLSFSPYTCSTLLAPSCGRILKHFCLVWDPKMSQSWRFIGKTDAEAEAAIVWHLIRRTDSLEKTLWLHGDCSHEIKRCLLLGRKAVTNLDSILKSRDITLPTKVSQSELWFFQWSCMDVRVGL